MVVLVAIWGILTKVACQGVSIICTVFQGVTPVLSRYMYMNYPSLKVPPASFEYCLVSTEYGPRAGGI